MSDDVSPSTASSPAPLATSSPTSRWPDAAEWTSALDTASQLALDYLASLPDSPVSHHASPETMAPRFDMPLPEGSCTAAEALRDWFERAEPGIVRSPGPRYFGFVTGGVTPAALAGDWLASAIDQNAATWLMSPAAAQTELSSIQWLLELFGLPATWSGALTSGATMANLSGLAAARQWASTRLGYDASLDGLGGHTPIAVVGSTEVHQSALKALAILGLGRDAVQTVPAPEGVIDLETFDRALETINGPVIVIANAGEVNTGAFDPIVAIASRCAEHPPGAWLHVDGAFGLYAALAPSHRGLIEGIEFADSVATDAHKWLNVPYDCGVVFVRERHWLQRAFGGAAAYLNTEPDAAIWNAFEHVPEMSRRFRALAVWCALRASGRAGYRAIVERSLENARRFGAWVSAQPHLELMAPVHLNIVCFRVTDSTGRDTATDALNAAVIEHLQRSGIAYATATRWNGHAAIRAAFDNWATGDDDVAALEAAIAESVSTTLAARCDAFISCS